MYIHCWMLKAPQNHMQWNLKKTTVALWWCMKRMTNHVKTMLSLQKALSLLLLQGLVLLSLDLIILVAFHLQGCVIPWGTPIDQSVVGSDIVAARWMVLTWTSSKPLKHTLWECESPLICFYILSFKRWSSLSKRLNNERKFCSLYQETDRWG